MRQPEPPGIRFYGLHDMKSEIWFLLGKNKGS